MFKIKFILFFLIFYSLTITSCDTNKSTNWRKMNCGLYMSSDGDLGYASIPDRANLDPSELKEEECPNYFLTTFGYNDTTQLKYVIDTLTFKHIGSDFYKDTVNIYSYYPMHDGGYFNLLSSEVSDFEWLNGDYYIYKSNIEHYREGSLDADYNTFSVSYKYNHLACDKDYVYYFGKKMTFEEFEQNDENHSKEVIKEVEKLQDFIESKFIDIDTNYFSTGSMLYWQWDRDSTWMTFENLEHSKTILEVATSFYTNRIGLCFLKEYDDFLLFKYRWISGCCTPPDIVFMNKKTGKEIDRISTDRFIWRESEDDYIIYFSDSLYNSITYFNLSNNTKCETNLPLSNGTSKLSLIVSYNNYPNDIFNPPIIGINHILLEYNYYHSEFKDSLMTGVVRIKK